LVANETTSFAYDTSYRLSSITNPRGVVAYTYTAADQVQSYQVGCYPGGVSLEAPAFKAPDHSSHKGGNGPDQT